MPKGSVAPGKVLPPPSAPRNGSTRRACCACEAVGIDKKSAIRIGRENVLGMAPRHSGKNIIQLHYPLRVDSSLQPQELRSTSRLASTTGLFLILLGRFIPGLRSS